MCCLIGWHLRGSSEATGKQFTNWHCHCQNHHHHHCRHHRFNHHHHKHHRRHHRSNHHHHHHRRHRYNHHHHKHHCRHHRSNRHHHHHLEYQVTSSSNCHIEHFSHHHHHEYHWWLNHDDDDHQPIMMIAKPLMKTITWMSSMAKKDSRLSLRPGEKSFWWQQKGFLRHKTEKWQEHDLITDNSLETFS